MIPRLSWFSAYVFFKPSLSLCVLMGEINQPKQRRYRATSLSFSSWADEQPPFYASHTLSTHPSLLDTLDIICIDCGSLPMLRIDLHRSDFGFTNSLIRAAQVGQLLVNLYINPKLIFVTLSPSIYRICMLDTKPPRPPFAPSCDKHTF